jgi:peptidylprolyl isomerase
MLRHRAIAVLLLLAAVACSSESTTNGPARPTTPPDVAAPPADAQKTASGLAFKILKAGSGTDHPTPMSTVRVHYTGWKTDGEMIDSSVVRGEPAEFGLFQVIDGWTEGLQLMTAGETRRFWIPGSLAYDGMPGRPQGMLVFDIELLEIK